jgi:hypothetical protein
MAHVSASIDIPVSPDEIWRLIGGFGSLPDWLSFMPTSELTEGGRVRRLANRDGETLVERPSMTPPRYCMPALPLRS